MRRLLPIINVNVKSAQAWCPLTATLSRPRRSPLIIDGSANCIRSAEAATRDDATVIGIAASGSTVYDARHLCGVRLVSSRSLQIVDGIRDRLTLSGRYSALFTVIGPTVQ